MAFCHDGAETGGGGRVEQARNGGGWMGKLPSMRAFEQNIQVPTHLPLSSRDYNHSVVGNNLLIYLPL